MQQNQLKNLSPSLLVIFDEYQKVSLLKGREKENESQVVSAVWYEKIRAAVEYQEAHLIFKNAIARILKRNILLIPKIKSEKLLNNLINELVWANYITPTTINEKKFLEVDKVIDKYLTIIRNSNSAHKTKTELIQYLCGLASAEIEESMNPKDADKFYLDFVYGAIKDNFQLKGSHISPSENEIQIRLAIIVNVFKPDVNLLHYHTLLLVEPGWKKVSEKRIKEISRSVDPFINRIDRQVYHPFRNQYMVAVRNLASPFIVLRTTFLSEKISKENITCNHSLLLLKSLEIYNSLKKQSNDKIWIGTFRALIFVFFTKMILAFLVEVPVDRYFHDQIHWFALTINITLPPLLMLLSGLTIPKISKKNGQLISESLEGVIFNNKINTEKPIIIGYKKRNRSSTVFEFFLWLISIFILGSVIWLLMKLKFTYISIVLFFIFISAVSFLSFRIRTNSKDLIVKRSRQDSATSVIEFVFLPFIRIGKVMSDGLNRLNPFLLVLDFLIEAPFKTIIKIMRSWFAFISTKKDELEY